MRELLLELYQFTFISSIFFMVYIFLGIAMKIYGKFIEKTDEKFILTISEKILFWLSLTCIFSFLI